MRADRRVSVLTRGKSMNTNVIVAAFTIAVTVIIWFGTTNNDESWTGNRNVCVGECYETWKAENGGSIADLERVKQEALASASCFTRSRSAMLPPFSAFHVS